MKTFCVFSTLGALVALSPALSAASTGNAFYGDAPDATHPWAVHDRNRPQPKIVTPGTFSTQEQPGKPPSDAIILFDGKDLSGWESDKDGSPTQWIVKDGAMECVPKSGYIRTKKEFGDCQLHVEWTAPTKVEGESQGRGNSGVFLPGGLEIQVLDNYDNPSYADGMAGCLYGVNPPMANALRPPGQFQSYDIVFRRPIYKGNEVVDRGYVTVFINGILVQDHTPIEGHGGHMKRSTPCPFPEKGPLKLQDHGNPVRYRNIWYRELPPRISEGGTDGGYLTAEATAAKRKEIAAMVRKDAATQPTPLAQMLRWMESLSYEKEVGAMQKVEQMAGNYAASLKSLSGDSATAKKDEVKQVSNAFKYLAKFNILPATFGPAVEIETFIKAQGWDKDNAKKKKK